MAGLDAISRKIEFRQKSPLSWRGPGDSRFVRRAILSGATFRSLPARRQRREQEFPALSHVPVKLRDAQEDILCFPNLQV